MENAIVEQIVELSKKVAESITDEHVEMCKDILSKTVKNISNFIGRHLAIHEKIYMNNESYRDFVNNVFDDKSYKRIVNIGKSQKLLDTTNNIRSLGLFGLTKKVFGFGNKNVEKKYLEWLDSVAVVLDAYNLHIDTGADFVLLLLTLLDYKQIAMKVIVDEIANNANFE